MSITFIFTSATTLKQETVVADRVSITQNGELLFLVSDEISYAVAPGFWADVKEDGQLDDNS